MKIKFLNGEVEVNDRDLLLVVEDFPEQDLDEDDIYVIQFVWCYGNPYFTYFGTVFNTDLDEDMIIKLNFIKKVDVGVPEEYLKLWKGEN